MNHVLAQSSDVLLTRVNQELEQISDLQHRLARRKAILQSQATRLRLGASPLEVEVLLESATRVADEALF